VPFDRAAGKEPPAADLHLPFRICTCGIADVGGFPAVGNGGKHRGMTARPSR